jgi:hypothetical protein
MLPEKKPIEHTVAVVSVRLSFHPSELIPPKTLSQIGVVVNKCSFRRELVDQGLSRSYWKVHSHSEYISKNKILTFLHITVKDTDMRSSETYTECYRQYVHYIKYGPLGQLHPQKREIAKYLENY